MVRVGVQLADARTGEIIWSETFDRNLTPGPQLAVRGDIAAQVASTLAQTKGVFRSDVAGRSASRTIADKLGFSPDEGTRLAAGESAE
jgi:hypothetical protein